MPTLSVKLPLKEERNLHGKRTGRLICTMGQFEACSNNREELETAVKKAVVRSAQRPQVGLVQMGEYLQIVVTYGDEVDIYRIEDDAPANGIIPLKLLSGGHSPNHQANVQGALNHVYQNAYVPSMGEVPPHPHMDPERASNWRSWVSWQLAK
jgi:hypothetical protein